MISLSTELDYWQGRNSWAWASLSYSATTAVTVTYHPTAAVAMSMTENEGVTVTENVTATVNVTLNVGATVSVTTNTMSASVFVRVEIDFSQKYRGPLAMSESCFSWRDSAFFQSNCQSFSTASVRFHGLACQKDWHLNFVDYPWNQMNRTQVVLVPSLIRLVAAHWTRSCYLLLSQRLRLDLMSSCPLRLSLTAYSAFFVYPKLVPTAATGQNFKDVLSSNWKPHRSYSALVCLFAPPVGELWAFSGRRVLTRWKTFYSASCCCGCASKQTQAEMESC